MVVIKNMQLAPLWASYFSETQTPAPLTLCAFELTQPCSAESAYDSDTPCDMCVSVCVCV